MSGKGSLLDELEALRELERAWREERARTGSFVLKGLSLERKISEILKRVDEARGEGKKAEKAKVDHDHGGEAGSA